MKLVFTWQGDRFLHTLRHGDDGLVSAESPDLETPVYQEVHQQGDLVFASGMSGDRHWSASVEPVEGGFAFDVACRVKTAAQDLGVAYTGDAALLIEPSDESELCEHERARLVYFSSAAEEPPYTARCRYRIAFG